MSTSLRSKSDKKCLLSTFFSFCLWRTLLWRILFRHILRRISVLRCNRNVFKVLACFSNSLTCLSLFHLKGVPRWSRADTTGLKYFWRSILTFLRLHLYTIRYNMIRYDTIRYDTIRYDTIRYDTIQHNTIQYNSIRWDAIR